MEPSQHPAAGESAMGEAVRLFNERAYYECHDVLEEEWADARGVRREVLKALVKLAAGMYHLQTSGYRGAGSLLSSGLEALDALPPDAVFVEIPPCGTRSRVVSENSRRWRPAGRSSGSKMTGRDSDCGPPTPRAPHPLLPGDADLKYTVNRVRIRPLRHVRTKSGLAPTAP